MLLAGKSREILNLTDVHGSRLAGKGREGKGGRCYGYRMKGCIEFEYSRPHQ
jgi:hypothetical protein